MSENSSEFLKRTCLICGCHTNQTINIYEPRGGPNIVQLIQAKFKFQPLNEDKYLCFSCNNWLINWHSLQALNSNDAESPSGTFRSHLNSGNVMHDEKSSGSKKQKATCRPIAVVRPHLVQEPTRDDSPSMNVMGWEPEEIRKHGSKINYNKRNFRWQLGRRGRLQHKSMQLCSCGKWIIVRSSTKLMNSKLQQQPQCRKCRELLRLKTNYMRSIEQIGRKLAVREPILHVLQSVVPEHQSTLHDQSPTTHQDIKHQTKCLPRPTVDGKVVSMLRRLGTTLSCEAKTSNESNTVSRLPQIMSPTKAIKQWLRPLEDDEILLNFDSTVSEVLPSAHAYQFTSVNFSAAKRTLKFPMSETAEVIDLCEKNDEGQESHIQGLQKLDNSIATSLSLPKGLTITLN